MERQAESRAAPLFHFSFFLFKSWYICFRYKTHTEDVRKLLWVFSTLINSSNLLEMNNPANCAQGNVLVYTRFMYIGTNACLPAFITNPMVFNFLLVSNGGASMLWGQLIPRLWLECLAHIPRDSYLTSARVRILHRESTGPGHAACSKIPSIVEYDIAPETCFSIFVGLEIEWYMMFQYSQLAKSSSRIGWMPNYKLI